MKRTLALFLPVALLLVAPHRLPAPISEQSPTPKPQPIKAPVKKEAGLTATETSVVAAKIKEAMNKGSAAWATHDSALMRSLLADNFVSVRPNGNVANKEAFLDEFKSDTSIYEFVGFDSLDVHVDSRTMAVVTRTWRFRGKTISGKHFDNVYRVTDTLTKRNGVWQCTADQGVRVSPR